MAKARTPSSSTPIKKRRQAIGTEARENQMIGYAMNLAEQRLLDGTASSQEVVHFLKLGTMKHRLEMAKLEEENKLLQAKTKAYDTNEEIKALYEDALKAMRNYAGQGDPDEYNEY